MQELLYYIHLLMIQSESDSQAAYPVSQWQNREDTLNCCVWNYFTDWLRYWVGVIWNAFLKERMKCSAFG